MRLPRTAAALYIALAVHALVLLSLALGRPTQESSGSGQGLRVRGASLSAGELRLANGSPALPIESSIKPAPSRTARRLATGREADITAGPASEKAANSGPQEQTGGGGRDLYFARLRAHLAGFRRELRPGLPAASSRVRVAITRDGWIEELVLVESSGLPELDAEAMDLVRRAAPLPAPPRGRAVRLIVPVEIVPAD